MQRTRMTTSIRRRTRSSRHQAGDRYHCRSIRAEAHSDSQPSPSLCRRHSRRQRLASPAHCSPARACTGIPRRQPGDRRREGTGTQESVCSNRGTQRAHACPVPCYPRNHHRRRFWATSGAIKRDQKWRLSEWWWVCVCELRHTHAPCRPSARAVVRCTKPLAFPPFIKTYGLYRTHRPCCTRRSRIPARRQSRSVAGSTCIQACTPGAVGHFPR